ncbi:hypothetical protein KKJ06_13180 [Xenorhabdus bovienii]|uniref:hypothetical protein n=1 Tax=Xenorhabdus bovienii TaxID=40576 RepID=UPI0012D2EB49|nr:hypothetical protein [Xenorhabdus bovienii]MDE9495115.1 hypothetical protein [Xenorhabdus bovienii]MDE9503508.1 hypothetical protein [Xenorhabdus bovienii]MDE9518404.1 hypothetical protein [Xenorhabdus bovienii]MDE9556359.1 hypothetical protein [Xenorhabdus bovienii]
MTIFLLLPVFLLDMRLKKTNHSLSAIHAMEKSRHYRFVGNVRVLGIYADERDADENDDDNDEDEDEGEDE